MAIGPRLDLRQTQSLVMTPQLQQAIKLLQLSHTDLVAYVEGELEQNPMLERDEGQNDPAADNSAGDRDDPAPEETYDGQDSLELLGPSSLADGTDSPLDADYSNDYEADIAGPGTDLPGGEGSLHFQTSGGGGSFDNDEYSLEGMVSSEQSLGDYLTEQLQMEIADPGQRLIGLYLIDMLDEAGYLTGKLTDVAEALGCSEDDVEEVLLAMQEFDPSGIFARSLMECLEIQLREQGRLTKPARALLNNLNLLGAHDARGLKRVTGLDDAALNDLVQEIRTLDPKPALAFDAPMAQPVVPDVMMKPDPEGGWGVELNSDVLPKVLVNDHYYKAVNKTARTKDDKDYLSERYQTANWLVKSLHQRATTILKVSAEIVRQQEGFFKYGISKLKPLVLRDIAEAVELHESTVSRVTSNKYIATPRGLFELKYFFTSSISHTGFGDAHSAEAVKHRIKKLVDEEPPKKILSDDKIVELLKAEGMDIARRTVAKYREAMKIPSSVQRRRIKNQAL